jgi:prolyl-tRNA editing enzyme YbaK/EbsC (Cys-tRNA(Pro) deacylase)
MGAAKVRIATPDEVVAATGFEPGAVAPFPLPRVQRVLVERTLLSSPLVWVGAGSDRHMAALSPLELMRLTRGEAVDVVQESA